jgi:hypothetical protein
MVAAVCTEKKKACEYEEMPSTHSSDIWKYKNAKAPYCRHDSHVATETAQISTLHSSSRGDVRRECKIERTENESASRASAGEGSIQQFASERACLPEHAVEG